MAPRNSPKKTSRYMKYLSIWIGFVSLMAFGNTMQCFVDHSFLYSRLYTVSESNVNGLVARLFGIWTLISGVLRFSCAIDIYNKAVYNLTLVSFVVVFVHYVTEILIYNTVELCVGVSAPFIVSFISIAFMIHGYKYLSPARVPQNNENEELSSKFKKKYG
ncbi:ergosterol biosynthetic protein 28 homolog [Haliotis rubra]|uniref:ergosterol biosynthetic protein 28 homolog n=1 Tax=Haliotis rubra TaxID=36100 RepID=UPI001EE5BE18|nr:ergosterol biosynthetic protein 28 homolog [Haliotis rubra]